MGKFQGESGVDADNHTLYIIHNAMISFVNAVSGKELFIPLSNTDESEGCDHCHLWLLMDAYRPGEVLGPKQRQDELELRFHV